MEQATQEAFGVSVRIRVRALGQFWVAVDDRELPRADTKVTSLLKVIVALGPGPIAQERLAHALRPAADARRAQGGFDITLHRLRRWLGVRAAVSLTRGFVQLAPELCWVDAHAFRNAVAGRDELSAEMLVALYAGKFLPDCESQCWAEPQREAIHARYLRAVVRFGRERERARAWRSASLLYEHALQIDDLHAPLYQGLIRCQLALGQRVEALCSSERCRRRLEHALGTPPHEHTRALVRGARVTRSAPGASRGHEDALER